MTDQFEGSGAEPYVLVSHDQGVATITLNRGAQRNPLSEPMRSALALAVEQVRDDASVKAVVLTGAGTSFCAGGDLSQMAQPIPGGFTWRDRIKRIHRWLPELMNLEKPVIAAIDGAAFGAGLSLALACDFVIATPQARFCAVFSRIGFVPDMGAMQLLPRTVGMQRAKDLVFTARVFGANEAHSLGIVTEIVPQQDLLARAEAFAARFRTAPTEAIGLAKSIMGQAFNLDAHAMAEMEAYAQALCRDSGFHREAVQRFQDKQPPLFDWGA